MEKRKGLHIFLIVLLCLAVVGLATFIIINLHAVAGFVMTMGTVVAVFFMLIISIFT